MLDRAALVDAVVLGHAELDSGQCGRLVIVDITAGNYTRSGQRILVFIPDAVIVKVGLGQSTMLSRAALVDAHFWRPLHLARPTQP